jgi:signal transduction histidine kinase
MNRPQYVLRSETEGWYVSAMEYLVDVVQDLSHARDLDTVAAIVRKAARNLTGADGATFVLRDDDKCYYMDEDALEPLWKGSRFPMDICVSGWVMRHAKPVIIDDIFQDDRVPLDVYRKTFIKSMAMVPIRINEPIGAIGNYWANKRHPTQEEISVLQALANVTAVTLENIDLYGQLQTKIKALEISNEELNHFAWAASHDLKSPLRAVENLATWVEEETSGQLSPNGRKWMDMLRGRIRRMEKLLTDILDFAQIDYHLDRQSEELAYGQDLINDIRDIVELGDHFQLETSADFLSMKWPRKAMTRILINLIGNAIKHHDQGKGIIRISVRDENGKYVVSVSDDGPGIAEKYHDKVFEMFQTIAPRDTKEGSGIGLSIVKKIISLYDGDIWIEPQNQRGATFSFSWPKEVF